MVRLYIYTEVEKVVFPDYLYIMGYCILGYNRETDKEK